MNNLLKVNIKVCGGTESILLVYLTPNVFVLLRSILFFFSFLVLIRYMRVSFVFFFLVKGQTVTPQARPPHGPLVITDVKKDDAVYKGTCTRIKEILDP